MNSRRLRVYPSSSSSSSTVNYGAKVFDEKINTRDRGGSMTAVAVAARKGTQQKHSRAAESTAAVQQRLQSRCSRL
ncbi:hypothetical protein V9T40_000643 [Parthenolecanium corni]|uniref:Uncharacterized protein n=1 Tax=Parthenolecanium corni TaxID=536013 RepID=A0AAN9TD98_9HEMI